MQWLMGGAFVVTWSSGFVGATLASRTGVAPLALLGWRYVVTGVVLALVCVLVPPIRDGVRGMRPRDVGEQVLLGVLAHVVFLGGVFLSAEQGLDAGISALVCALQPMVVAGASTRLFGDRLGCVQWIGLAVALVGVGVSVGGIDSSAVAGVCLVVASLAALCAAALLERACAPQVPVLGALLLQVATGAVVFTVAAAATGGMEVEVSGTFLAAMAWLVALSGLAGYATFTWCLRRLGATPTSTLLYFTAPVTMLWAWAMFDQHPTPMQWLGLTVVMGGVAMTLRPHAPPA